eukprot:scaffold174848_cov30-Tisochrysis_lutea.AAC.1
MSFQARFHFPSHSTQLLQSKWFVQPRHTQPPNPRGTTDRRECGDWPTWPTSWHELPRRAPRAAQAHRAVARRRHARPPHGCERRALKASLAVARQGRSVALLAMGLTARLQQHPAPRPPHPKACCRSQAQAPCGWGRKRGRAPASVMPLARTLRTERREHAQRGRGTASSRA